MRLSVATNFESDLIEGLSDYPILELYGKLREDAIGGGRASYHLAYVSKNKLEKHVRLAHEKGIEFNYLLNSACLGNREITRPGQKEIESLLDWLCNIKVDSVTVASPYLLKMIKLRYPALKVRISTFSGVDRVIKAKMWEDMGADCIVLDGLLVNRELKTLEKIRNAIKTDLELLVNNNCLQSCIFCNTHVNSLAHTGQSWHMNKGFFIDWCYMKCTHMKLKNPVNYIRSEWIRPEDLHIYEDLGYDRFKIVERDIPTEVLLNRVNAYCQRRYDGNLLDLIQPYSFKGIKYDKRFYKQGLGWMLKFFFRPNLVNPMKLKLLKNVVDLRDMSAPVEGEEAVYIDNKLMDGFITRFMEKGCRDEDCENCSWCYHFAEKAIRLNEDRRNKALDAYDALFLSMESGDMWKYLPQKNNGNGSCEMSEI